MPTYEYRCPEGHEFERFYRKMSDAAAELPCPECGKEATRKLSGGAGLVFKGSGFYLTDYGKNAHRTGGSSGSSSASKSEKSESTPSESKSGDAKSSDAKSSESKAESKSESKATGSTGTSSGSAASSPKSDK